MKKLTDKLEVMVVDDDPLHLETYQDLVEMQGYQATTTEDSYKAIHELAIRLFRNQDLPEILLCDLRDERYTLAVMNIWKGDAYPEATRKMKTIHPSMVFNVWNYLQSQGIKPQYLIGFTSCASDEDLETARRLKILLIEKEKISELFPDVSGMHYGDAGLVFGENYAELMQGR